MSLESTSTKLMIVTPALTGTKLKLAHSRFRANDRSPLGCLSWFGTVCDGVHTICSILWKCGIRVTEEVEGGMRRRSRHTPNISESTGKIGQEIPSNQPAPLVPFYPDDAPAAAATQHPRAHRLPETRPAALRAAAPDKPAAPEKPSKPARLPRPEWNEPPESGRFELETQPELSVPQPEAEAADRLPLAPKGFVVLAIGLPGSGKTTWFRRRGVTPLSSDLLRNILFDDVEEQRYQGLVFSTLRSLLRARLIARMPLNYVDATNLSIHERRQWIKMAKSFGYEVQAVFFDVPLEVCLERNSKRDRSVSEDVMRKMAEKLKPPVFEEGFEKITVVRVKNAG
jgi:predicted kinase